MPRHLSCRIVCGIAGAALGFVVPLVYGVYCIYSVRSTPARLPNLAVDGTPAFIGLIVIVAGSPIGATCLFALGYLIGLLFEACLKRLASWRSQP